MRRRLVVDVVDTWRLVNAKNKDFINFTFWGEPFWGKSRIVSVWIFVQISAAGGAGYLAAEMGGILGVAGSTGGVSMANGAVYTR